MNKLQFIGLQVEYFVLI